MKQIRRKWIVFGVGLCLLVLSMLLAAREVQKNRRYVIEDTVYSVLRDGKLYGVDITEDDYRVYRIDVETGYGESVRIQRISYQKSISVEDIAVAQDGNAYVCVSEKEETQTNTWIARCDFASGSAEKVWTKEDICTPSAYFLLGNDAEGIYLYMYTSNRVLTRFVLDEETGVWLRQSDYTLGAASGLLDVDKNLWGVDTEGNIYRFLPNADETELVFANDGSKIGKSNFAQRADEAGRLHFYNLDAKQEYVIEKQADTWVLAPCEVCQEARAQLSELDFMEAFDVKNGGVSSGTTWLGEKQCVPFVHDAKGLHIFSEFVRAPKDLLLDWVKLSLKYTLYMFAFCLFIFVVLKCNHGFLPLFVQLLCVLVPLLGLVFFQASEALYTQLMERMVQMEQANLVQSALVYESGLQDDEINVQTMQKANWFKMGEAAYDDFLGAGEISLANDYYGVYYYSVAEDGSIYDLSGEEGDTSVPIRYLLGKPRYEAIKRTALQGKHVVLAWQDVNGKWLSAYVAHTDASGRIGAVIEFRSDYQQSLREASEPVGMVLVVMVVAVAALGGAILLVLFVNLRPLRSLSAAVEAIAGGKLETRLRTHLHLTQIGRIAQVFNQMAENISRNVEELRETGKKYAFFVPAQFFGYLGKASILETKRGDCAEDEFVVMSLASVNFEEASGAITGEENFEVINRALDKLVPEMELHGGMIAAFQNAGALSVYKEQAGEVLVAAISALEKLNGERLVAGGKALRYTAGICFGPVRLGIIGAGHRSEAAAMSLNCQYAAILQHLAARYGAGILITGDAAKHVPDFASAYHYRILGYGWFSSKQVVDVIYDVYDADEADSRRHKEHTKAHFEEGVRLYMAKQYQEARNCFVQVLYENRADRAAEAYFLRCEAQLSGETVAQYLEVF